MGQQKFTYKGMTKDLAKSKKNPEYYYDAKNIRILSTDKETTLALTTEKGNILKYNLNDPYQVDNIILGYNVIDNYIILFIYHTELIQEVKRITISTGEQYKLVYGNLGFQLNTLFTSEVFYENENILKIYWADGVNTLRYMNILDPPEDISLLDACPSFVVSSPELEGTSYGGIHTSGMIQYCYNLYSKYGAQTKVSPRSELIPLKKQLGGGDVNEIVGQINHIKIDNVDTKFDIIRLYAIKYTSYNQSPIVSLVAEESIGKVKGVPTTTIRFKDDGNVIYNISEKELLFLGGENLIPAHIASKFNYLILGDIKENFFDIDISEYDTRAYRWLKNTIVGEDWHFSKIKNKDGDYERIQTYINNNIVLPDSNFINIPYTHDCINEMLVPGSTIQYIPTSINGSAILTGEFDTFNSGELDEEENPVLFDGILLNQTPETPPIVGSGDYIVKISFQLVDEPVVVEESQLLESYTWKDLKDYITNRYNYLLINNTDHLRATLNPYNILGYECIGFIDPKTRTSGIDIIGSDTKVEIFNVIQGSTVVVDNSDSIYAYKYNTPSGEETTPVFGATGTNIELEIVQSSGVEAKNILKSREIYRFAIEFYNNRGQVTPPKWICDLYIPDGNLDSTKINTLKVTLSNTDKLTDLGVVGWNVLRVERTDANKTIITQGIINPCVFQQYDLDIPTSDGVPNEATYDAFGKVEALGSNPHIKMVSPFMRNMENLYDDSITTLLDTPIWPISLFTDGDLIPKKYTPKIKRIQNGGVISYPVMNHQEQHLNFPFAEVYKKHVFKPPGELTSHNTFEFTQMFQLYSPELIFLNPIFGNNLKYTVVGKLDNTINDCSVWGKQIATTDAEYIIRGDNWLTSTDDIRKSVKKGEIISEVRTDNHFNLFNKCEARQNGETYSSLHKTGLIGPTGGRSERQNLYQYYRNYSIDTDYTPIHYEKDILGNPIIIGKGESSKVYNATIDNVNVESRYTFHNHLFTLIADRNTLEPIEVQAPIISVNSIGANCLNIVSGDSKLNTTEETLESVLTFNGITNSDSSTALIEVRRTLTNQYGGNTLEARSRNRYLRIGRYVPITTTTTTINRAGDCFVSNFKFLRIIPNIAQVENSRYTAMCEIVEFPVESTIDNTCRNDYSLNSWDSAWHPSFDEYHNYNRVYSQEPISNVNIATPFTFEEVKHSSIRLLSTKVKTPGELIDSWTDILVNEELNLNGQYGKLTKLIRNNDNLFFFQDNALGVIQVKPRVAIQASDGIGVELGTGQILYNYQYLSTASGSTNPNCVFASPNYVYYIDVTNKTLNRVSEKGVEGLSDPAGLHSYMYNNILMSYDNLLTVVGVYDNVNDEAYFTCPYVDSEHQGFTLVYNESLEGFTSFYSFKPKFYMKIPGRLFSSNDYKTIYEHFLGDYCKFYGTVYDSEITFFANPQQDGGLKTRFDNLAFNAELTQDGVDIFLDENTNTYTLPIKKLQVTTDYQQTQDTILVYGTHIKRKFRNWSLVIPRAYNFTLAKSTLDRMRGEWAYIKLTIDNTENNKLVLHDVILSYE